MNKQTLVYAQFLTEGGEKFTGTASFPIPKEFADPAFLGHALNDMRLSIITASGDPIDIITSQLRNTISLHAYAYAQEFPKEEFGSRRKEKFDELCGKFNLTV